MTSINSTAAVLWTKKKNTKFKTFKIMEYYEDIFASEQQEQCEIFTYYTLEFDGAVYAQGTYEDCLAERAEQVRQYGKQFGISASDFKINPHTFTL